MGMAPQTIVLGGPMSSVTRDTFDMRTRDGSTRAPVEPAEHTVARWVEQSRTASWWSRSVAFYEPRPLRLVVDDHAWVFVAEAGGIRVTADVERGDRSDQRIATLAITKPDFEDLIEDLVSPIGWWSSGHLEIGRDLNVILDWWLLIRGLIDGAAPYVNGDVQLSDPSLWMRSFTMGEDPVEDMQAFLGTYGFLHLRSLFGEDDMSAIATEMEAMAPLYKPGDGNSWWATDADGVEHLVRCENADQHSPTIAEIVTRPEFLTIGDIPGVGHKWARRAENKIEALTKPLNIVSGISDVPWHKDCSLGRHSHMCCRLTVGISVTAGTADSGLLRVVAGSHRARTWPALSRKGFDLPVVPLPTAVGDATVHLSCTLHEALPPTRIERKVLYTDFGLPDRNGSGGVWDPRLSEIREKAAQTVSQPAAAGPRPTF